MAYLETQAAAAIDEILLHDLSQPLGAAALSIETAALLLDRNEVDSCRERIDAASNRVARCNLLLRAMKLARGAEPSPWVSQFDPSEVIRAVWADMQTERVPAMVGDSAFLEAALTGLSLVFSPDASRTVTVAHGADISLIGRTKKPELMSFWLRAIRKTGIKVAVRRRGEHVTMTLTIPTMGPPMTGESAVRDRENHAKTRVV